MKKPNLYIYNIYKDTEREGEGRREEEIQSEREKERNKIMSMKRKKIIKLRIKICMKKIKFMDYKSFKKMLKGIRSST